MPEIIHYCERCGKEFLAYKIHKRKYCSRKCSDFAEKKTIKCENCGKKFKLLKSHLRVRVRFGKTRYCSKKCYFEAIKIKDIECSQCHKLFKPLRKSSVFCSARCVSDSRKGIKKGDGFWYENGYKVIYTDNGNGIKEHIKIMEEYLGRKIDQYECVHHCNEIRDDNRLENLELMLIGEHSSWHRKKEIANGITLFKSNAQ